MIPTGTTSGPVMISFPVSLPSLLFSVFFYLQLSLCFSRQCLKLDPSPTVQVLSFIFIHLFVLYHLILVSSYSFARCLIEYGSFVMLVSW